MVAGVLDGADAVDAAMTTGGSATVAIGLGEGKGCEGAGLFPANARATPQTTTAADTRSIGHRQPTPARRPRLPTRWVVSIDAAVFVSASGSARGPS